MKITQICCNLVFQCAKFLISYGVTESGPSAGRVGSGRGSDLILPHIFADYFPLFVFLLLSFDEVNNTGRR